MEDRALHFRPTFAATPKTPVLKSASVEGSGTSLNPGAVIVPSNDVVVGGENPGAHSCAGFGDISCCVKKRAGATGNDVILIDIQ